MIQQGLKYKLYIPHEGSVKYKTIMGTRSTKLKLTTKLINTHTRTHVRTHARTHTHTRTHVRTHAHTHTFKLATNHQSYR